MPTIPYSCLGHTYITSSVITVLFFKKNGTFQASFLYFRLFNTADTKQINIRCKSLPMTGFEPRTSGVGSNRSTNWATTTALLLTVLYAKIELTRRTTCESNLRTPVSCLRDEKNYVYQTSHTSPYLVCGQLSRCKIVCVGIALGHLCSLTLYL